MVARRRHQDLRQKLLNFNFRESTLRLFSKDLQRRQHGDSFHFQELVRVEMHHTHDILIEVDHGAGARGHGGRRRCAGRRRRARGVAPREREARVRGTRGGGGAPSSSVRH